MKVAVIVAHPDDETLGCGATIAKHFRSGDEVHLLTLSNGVSARLNSTQSEIETRRASLKKASSILGITDYKCEDFPDNQFDSVPLLKIIQKVELFLAKHQFTRVYTHFGSDLNIDHRIVYEAVCTACRATPWQSVKQILCFETLSSTEWSHDSSRPFKPQFFNDTTETFDIKINALEAYSQEMHLPPHTRSIENIKVLGSYRGMTVGTNFAEAFQIERWIDSK